MTSLCRVGAEPEATKVRLTCGLCRVRGALPYGFAHQERAQPVEVERRLLRLAHRLHEGRQRKQILSDESDDEVVVVAIEAVARESDVVRIVRRAEHLANRPVLGQDRALLLIRE